MFVIVLSLLRLCDSASPQESCVKQSLKTLLAPCMPFVRAHAYVRRHVWYSHTHARTRSAVVWRACGGIRHNDPARSPEAALSKGLRAGFAAGSSIAGHERVGSARVAARRLLAGKTPVPISRRLARSLDPAVCRLDRRKMIRVFARKTGVRPQAARLDTRARACLYFFEPNCRYT